MNDFSKLTKTNYMNSEFKSDAKFFAIGIIAGLLTLFLPVFLWNVWFLDYIDAHGKLVAFCLAPVFALISAGIIVGLTDLHQRLFGNNKGGINPFWGWFAVALIIEVVIVLLSNS
jgi:hypothetical protein